MRDEYAQSDMKGSGSTIDVSGLHSEKNRKCSSGAAKGKKEACTHSALSESVEKLANVDNELIAAHLKVNFGPLSFDECMEELESFGILEDDEKFNLFALSFFEQMRHRTSYAGSQMSQMKIKFLKFNYKSWCLKNTGAFDD
ncbi:Uncharacterized protein Adt_22749 [Abeliophyllum distichum]|uniref:Uncharacterized protein n=1 Tax=Abeliophyllum distichum TaxID=126358 RepID=A0ABD1SCF7_9LAMI